MRADARIAVVIPTLNEERAIGKVLSAVPGWADRIIVADNGSSDDTVMQARHFGAEIVLEPVKGYGSACRAGLTRVRDADVVVFLDGDYSDFPEQMDRLVEPIVSDRADLVIGSRVAGECELGALSPQQRVGNWLACWLIFHFWRVRYTDLGPFRAIRRDILEQLDMRDSNYGWTIEMQIKAARRALRVLEVPTSYRRRIGESKISGTFLGSFRAGAKILLLIFAALLDSRLSM